MEATVHLEGIRCDGAAYGGCGAACLIFWKEAWLNPIGRMGRSHPHRTAIGDRGCRVHRGPRLGGDEGPRLERQRPDLPVPSHLLAGGDLTPTLVGPSPVRRGLRVLERQRARNWRVVACTCSSTRPSGSLGGLRGQRTPHPLGTTASNGRGGGIPFPEEARPSPPPGQPTPTEQLGLAPGTPVRVRSYAEILDTLDGRNKNRGLLRRRGGPVLWQSHRVRSRVEKTIDERTGKLIDVRGTPFCWRTPVHGPLQRPPHVLSLGDLPVLARDLERLHAATMTAGLRSDPLSRC